MEVNEENETLMKQYDREKQRRKEIEEVSLIVGEGALVEHQSTDLPV